MAQDQKVVFPQSLAETFFEPASRAQVHKGLGLQEAHAIGSTIRFNKGFLRLLASAMGQLLLETPKRA